MPESRRDSRVRCEADGECEEIHLPSAISDLDPGVPDRLIAIVGPTASGKTELAMRLSRHLPVEVIGADSRQVYRHMDIGTAKPSLEERTLVPHHIVDFIDPDSEFSLGEYLVQVNNSIRNVKFNDNTPTLVGGTGQYVMAVLEGWQVPRISPDSDLRARLNLILATYGIEALLDELRELDAVAWEAVDQKNPRRVARAIERAKSGHRWGEQPTRVRPQFESIVVGISGDRAELYSRADRRFDQMMENGFVEEVERLLASGYGPQLPAMSGIGYSELADHVLNGTDLELVVQRAKYRTHRYIRQQSSWFKTSDERITWFGLSEIERAIDFIRDAYEAPRK